MLLVKFTIKDDVEMYIFVQTIDRSTKSDLFTESEFHATAGATAPAWQDGKIARIDGGELFPQTFAFLVDTKLSHLRSHAGDVVCYIVHIPETDADNQKNLAVELHSSASSKTLKEVFDVSGRTNKNDESNSINIKAHLHPRVGNPANILFLVELHCSDFSNITPVHGPRAILRGGKFEHLVRQSHLDLVDVIQVLKEKLIIALL